MQNKLKLVFLPCELHVATAEFSLEEHLEVLDIIEVKKSTRDPSANFKSFPRIQQHLGSLLVSQLLQDTARVLFPLPCRSFLDCCITPICCTHMQFEH